MGIRILVVVLFHIVTIQACSRPRELHPLSKLPCTTKLDAYKAITEAAKKKYDEYYNMLKEPRFKSEITPEIEAHHAQFEQLISQTLIEYANKIRDIEHESNIKTRLALCLAAIKWASERNHELLKLGLEIKQLIEDAISKKTGELSSHKVQIMKALRTCLNVFFMVDLAAKIGHDLLKLWNWVNNVETSEGIEDNLAKYQSNIKEFVGRLQEVVDEELGPDEIGQEAAEATRSELSEFLENLESGEELRTADAIREAENARVNQRITSSTAWRAAEAAESGEEISETSELAAAARASQADRALSTVRATEAEETLESARILEGTRVASTIRSIEGVKAADTVSIVQTTANVVPHHSIYVSVPTSVQAGVGTGVASSVATGLVSWITALIPG